MPNCSNILLSNYFAKPSFSTLVNLYTAYSYGGSKALSLFTTTSFMDGVLAKHGVDKHYVSLSAFWGYIGYKTIYEIRTSSLPNNYKIPLYFISVFVSASIVKYGNDFFQSKSNLDEIYQSLRLTSKFFDQNKTLEKIEHEFQNGYLSGFKEIMFQSNELISNKFISTTLLYQATDIIKLIFIQKLANSYSPTGKMLALLAIKEDSPFKFIFKHAFNKAVIKFINIIFDKYKSNLQNSIQNDLRMKVSELALKENNSQVIIKFADNISQFPYRISVTYEKASSEVSYLISTLITPLIVQTSQQSNPDNLNIIKIIDLYSPIITANLANHVLFSQLPINRLFDLFRSYFPQERSDLSKEFEESRSISGIPGANLEQTLTPISYTFNNIQEISKLGGNKFMLNKIIQYINLCSYYNYRESINNLNLTTKALLENLIEECIFTVIFKLKDIDQNNWFDIEYNLFKFYSLIGYGGSQVFSQGFGNIKEMNEILKQLVENNDFNAKRELNSNKLILNNYQLLSDQSILLDIQQLDFEVGHVYAVNGKIGTGKTTLLTDIAKCLNPFFYSKGLISYPSNNGEAFQQIFCGSEPFSPPATTLFERLTYRIPSEECAKYKDNLTEDILHYFSKFKQESFNKDILNIKISESVNKLSTGQGKIVLLISALLYKKYINKPALFIIDETLANIDIDTTKRVCEVIKEECGDSIIISVDHNARHNSIFYTDFINLEEYVPNDIQKYDTELSGDINNDGIIELIS